MKKASLPLLAIALLCGSQAQAERELLPFGQFARQPWSAVYYYANSGEAAPSDDWFAKNFDESSWSAIQGPISTVDEAPPYYVTEWQAAYGTYWVRRHFTVDRLSEIRDVYLYAIHDDACVVYLNGTLIYDNYYARTYDNMAVWNFDEAARALLTEGDNVLAVRVNEYGGAYAYMDNGLYAYGLLNAMFTDDRAWTGTFDRHRSDGNTIGYRYGQTFRCEQTIEGAPTGLYRLTANACGMEYYSNRANALAHKDDVMPGRLFVGDYEQPIPSAFTETADYDYGYCWDLDGQFVPYYVDGLPTAFKNGMYRCELWSYYEATDQQPLRVGIYGQAETDISRWSAWDNIDIAYYSEAEVATMLTEQVAVMQTLDAEHQQKSLSDQTKVYIDQAAAATTYAEKARLFADMKRHEPAVRTSMAAYVRLKTAQQTLAESLAATTDQTSPATIAEATALSQSTAEAYENGSLDNDGVAEAIAKMEKMVERLTYTYLDITISVPGSLGDSILSHVTDFVDVLSIKLSGTLDDDDISTLKGRLSQLREVDLTGVRMTALPDRLFSEHRLLEIVKLPAALESIGEYAFYQCYALRHIDLPTTLTAIYRYAFAECDNLQEAILPEGLTTLAERAFSSCDNMKYAKLPSTLKVISSDAFASNIHLQTVDFAQGLTHINRGAFYDCYELDNLKFPTSLYFIGSSAFSYNRALANIEFNEGLYQIEDNAFYDCDALTEVTLPSSLVLCNASPFDYCDNLVKVTCLSIEPPYMTDQIPYGLSMEGRELYVPALSLNVYKQSQGWDQFPTILPIDYLPENFTVLGDLKLTLPETIPADYKPNVDVIHDMRGSWYYQYGALTVNGSGTLSMQNFSLMWDNCYLYENSDRPRTHGILVNNSHLRSDNVAITMHNRNDRWNFVTFPFDVKVGDIATTADGTTNWVVRRYDGQSRAAGETDATWVRLAADDVMQAGQGYIMQSSRYVDNNWQNYSAFHLKAINNGNKNNIFLTEDATVALSEYESEFAHNRSWNLTGNPYPTYYDTRFMQFDAPITVWNIRNNTYTAYSPADDAYILNPGEAFFVQCPVGVSSLVFGKDGRQTDRTVREISAARAANAGRTVVNLSLSDGSNSDRTRVVLNDEASLQYEMGRDASKFMSSDKSVPQLYTTLQGVDYAINERPVADGAVALTAYLAAEGLCTISLDSDADGWQVTLEDKALGRMVTLTAGEGYAFQATAGTVADRFVLHFTKGTSGIDSMNNEQGTVDSKVFDLQGRRVNGSQPEKGVYIQDGKKVVLGK